MKKHVEAEVVKDWLLESFETTGEFLEVVGWIKVPFDLWMEFNEAQNETAEYWDLIGQLVAIR